MRILILGGTGMLGHKLWQVLARRFDTYVTLRQKWEQSGNNNLFERARTFDRTEAHDIASVRRVIAELQPQVVLNCIGIVKQREEASAAVPTILVNALFPHQLADLCQAGGARLIHFSTDCVFSGRRGSYTEDDPPDPTDFYGRTKLLGELDRPGCLTLRTSIIGWELHRRAGLLEWFASQRGCTVKGFRGAIYSGLSTAVFAELIGGIMEYFPDLNGIYHVASQPITKYDLLARLRGVLGWQDITVVPDDDFQCDRSLIAARFETTTGWSPPTWDTMIAALASEWPTYQRGRKAIQ